MPVFGHFPVYIGKTAIFDIKSPFYPTYTTPRGEMMCPVDSSTPHVGGMETYWTHEVFGVSVCSPILSFLTPYPTENFAKSKPLYRAASQIFGWSGYHIYTFGRGPGTNFVSRGSQQTPG